MRLIHLVGFYSYLEESDLKLALRTTGVGNLKIVNIEGNKVPLFIFLLSFSLMEEQARPALLKYNTVHCNFNLRV